MTISIKSRNSARSLSIRFDDSDWYDVALIDPNLAVKCRISSYLSNELLGEFFLQLAKETRPWPNHREWASLEEDLSISADCDSLGHVRFLVKIQILRGTPNQASVQAAIETEMGLLGEYAQQAKSLFAHST